MEGCGEAKKFHGYRDDLAAASFYLKCDVPVNKQNEACDSRFLMHWKLVFKNVGTLSAGLSLVFEVCLLEEF